MIISFFFFFFSNWNLILGISSVLFCFLLKLKIKIWHVLTVSKDYFLNAKYVFNNWVINNAIHLKITCFSTSECMFFALSLSTSFSNHSLSHWIDMLNPKLIIVFHLFILLNVLSRENFYHISVICLEVH